ncbi:hypothetical protein NBO_4g0037 [Nosema bombycis CQ1]|uniref:Uncharacterized protein n=1 Tax=Nosema bombycis (strain CQ1 / CVCC 102059) TaxID=578461 RepID=R0MBU6_NOSB1|nr:hypothetical protein NBO_4g0037 [Nosema bombycis CQ1]|eukprot:EOB15409.1 hypothetical protein NBO_4g0037 [Nosema bombycis CQ1]
MSVKRKKPNFMNNILIDTIDRGEELIRTDILSESIKLFQNRKVSLEIETNTQNIIKESNTNWNQEAQNNLNNLINGNNFDLVKEANEKYNTLRNTLFLEILEKYKNNNEKDCLSYEYLYKRILDSYDLLDEYDTTKYTNIPRSVYLDNKIRVHNMVMKLICGSKQMEHSSSMVIPLSGNLSQIIKHFHNGKSHTKVEYTDNKKQSFSKQKEIITLDEIDRVVEELDKMNNINKDLDIDINGNIIEIGNLIQSSDVIQGDKLINDNLIDNNDIIHKDFNRIESITNDSRYQLFLKRTSPTLLKLCDTPEEFVIKYEEVIKEKGIINDAVLKKKKWGSIKDLEVLPGIPPLEDVKWVKRDLNKFNACVVRYQNNFSLYKSEIPHIPTKELI